MILNKFHVYIIRELGDNGCEMSKTRFGENAKYSIVRLRSIRIDYSPV